MPLGRPLSPLTLLPAERQPLLDWTRRPKTAQALALRARIVLLCVTGLSNTEVARRLQVTGATVCKWRQRFVLLRLDGLLDEPRPGTSRRLSDAEVERVLAHTLETQPQAATHWPTRSLAQASGLSQSSISRIWRAFSLQPHRSGTFKLSRDPPFIDKVRDIVGLYLNPPDRALVLCVDEKSQIQALDRTAPLLPMRPGQIERRSHDYTRHGTTSLFAAFNVASGKVLGQMHRRHRSREFRRFLDTIDRNVAPDLDVHLILNKLWHAQNATHSPLAGPAPSLPPALHSHLGLLAESGRTLVRRVDAKTASPWGSSQHAPVGERHPPLHRPPQPESETLRLDQIRRPNPRIGRPAFVNGL
jgi:transposase